MPKTVVKRDGRIVEFDKTKIFKAILKAALSVKHKVKKHTDTNYIQKLTDEVVRRLDKEGKTQPHIEEIQDVVEKVLVEHGLYDIAKSYILYREKRAKERRLKAQMGVDDPLKLSVNACKLLAKRYLLKTPRGEIVESTKDMFLRVARYVGRWSNKGEPGEKEFYEVMSSLKFLPNSPTLFNAGVPAPIEIRNKDEYKVWMGVMKVAKKNELKKLCTGTLSACFVIPIYDDMNSIMFAAHYSAMVQKFGGGVGMSFSNLREKGRRIATTHGKACGPLLVMKLMSSVSDMITQGGKRQGANMGILRIDHPDIVEFITAKEKEGVLSNFNISVAITDEFMEAYMKSEKFPLHSPKDGKVVEEVDARFLFDMIVDMAWKTGDPGLIFIDEINRRFPVNSYEKIESTNPCGEQPLPPYTSCNLGSINLEKFVNEKGKIDWKDLERTVKIAMYFLDNVIDANHYPEVSIPDLNGKNDIHNARYIEFKTKLYRMVGLGVMGFANMLIKLGIRYGSKKSYRIAEDVMSFITRVARETSVEMGKKRGSFPTFKESVWAEKYEAMRNATCTTIAPTGSLSIIANTSSSIEPLFAVVFKRQLPIGDWYEINPLFEEYMQREGLLDQELIREAAKSYSIQHVEKIPKEIRELFVTAHDLSPEQHIRMQAAFQKHVDNAVSKTINMPYSATREDVKNAFLLAYKMKLKGLTIYRDGSKTGQPIVTGQVDRNLFSSSKCDLTGKGCL